MTPLTKLEKYKLSKLHKQLDFFGCKRKRFISVYANKPRIRVKLADKFEISDHQKDMIDSATDALQRNLALSGSLSLGLYSGMATFSNAVNQLNASRIGSQQAARAQAVATQNALDYQRMQMDRELRKSISNANAGMRGGAGQDIQSQHARLDQLPGQGQRSSPGGLGGFGQSHLSTLPPGWMMGV